MADERAVFYKANQTHILIFLSCGEGTFLILHFARLGRGWGFAPCMV